MVDRYGTYPNVTSPLFALQEMGGWESPEMVRRYAHLAADHLAPYAEPSEDQKRQAARAAPNLRSDEVRIMRTRSARSTAVAD